MKKKLLILSVLSLFMHASAWAISFVVDGIYYSTFYGNSEHKVYVTYESTSYNSYSGNVVIPETVTYDGTTYTVTEIGAKAFYNCTGLSSITIPSSVITLRADDFKGCTALKEVIMEDGEETLETFVDGITLDVQFCDSPIEKLYLGRSLIFWYYPPFMNKNELISVTIGNMVTEIGANAFYGCKNLTELTLGNSVTEIGNGAFGGCSSLTEVTIPNGVPVIGIAMFSQCTGLEKVTIGNSVAEIGNSAFLNCKNIVEINSKNPAPPTLADSGVWSYIDKESCVLNVPTDCKDIYSSTLYWKDFYNINEVDFATDDRYEELMSNIEDTQELLNEAWATITTDYADVKDDFSLLYSVISSQVESLTERVENYYSDSKLTEEVAEDIESQLTTLIENIETMLVSAKEAHEANEALIYDNRYEELMSNIEDTQELLNEVWATITTDYADVENSFTLLYSLIRDQVESLTERVENYYVEMKLTEEVANEIVIQLSEINENIESMLESAQEAHETNGIEEINVAINEGAKIYGISGIQLSTVQKGINIIRYSNGIAEKVLVK